MGKGRRGLPFLSCMPEWCFTVGNARNVVATSMHRSGVSRLTCARGDVGLASIGVCEKRLRQERPGKWGSKRLNGLRRKSLLVVSR